MRRRREQEGSLYRERGYWYLRYYDDRVIDGQLQRRRIARQLGIAEQGLAKELGTTKITKEQARDCSREILAVVNEAVTSPKTALRPETALRLVDFVEQVYFGKENQELELRGLRPSTIRGYRVIWNDQLLRYCGDAVNALWIRQVQTQDVQRVMNALALSGRLNVNSIKHAKSFLSGVFRLALQLGYHKGPNPVESTSIPKARPASETYAYSLEEIERMISLLPEPAATVIATAGYMGLRLGEIRGLLWENYRNAEMLISRSVWRSHAGDPKSAKSKAPVPVIRRLADLLEFHRARQGNPESGSVFRSETGTPMDLNNLLGRVIQPVLQCCAVCGEPRDSHKPGSKNEVSEGHKFVRDQSRPDWHGWHAFRRGIATNLYQLGVPDLTIQKILRHANVSTTQRCYIKPADQDAKAAMEKLDSAVEKAAASVSASKRTVETAVPVSRLTM